jgi:hypothetical protein
MGYILRAAAAAATFNELRERLDDMVFTSPRSFERGEIIKLIGLLIEIIAPLLEDIEFMDGLEIRKEHKAIAKLKNLNLALLDLDRGILHDALKHAANQTNAALSSEEMEFDNLLLELVAIVQQREGFATLKEAERHVAQRLLKASIKRRGKTITPPMLRSIRNHPKKWQARNPQPR